MDEPTNHLDLKSKDMLKNALQQYDGTLVVVSHDRHFLQGLADKIFEFRDGKVRQFLGDIDEYLEARKLEDFRQLEKENQVQKAKPEVKKETDKGLSYAERKQLDKDIRKAEKTVQTLESDIEVLEAKLDELDAKLHDPEAFKELSKEADFYEKYEADKARLEKMMQDWESAQEQLALLEKKKP